MVLLTSTIEKLSRIFYSTSMAYIASGVLGVIFLIYVLYNGYIYIFRPSQYKGIRFTTKNIAYITLLSAVSVTVTVIVSITFPITVFPPIRIAFEGLMVKITGYIFGPIVGLLSGILTDGLSLLFVPSYIHISYLIVIASYGFLSGCVMALKRASGRHQWILFWLTNLFVFVFGACAVIFTIYNSSSSSISLFHGLNVSKTGLVYVIGVGTLGTLAILWIIYFVYWRIDRTMRKWYELLPIIMLCIVCEYWVTTLISAWGDIAFLTAAQGNSSANYGLTMIARLAMAPLKIVFNTIVIYITYRALSPLIAKD